jgi:predicted RNA-binding Zn ribbon-like protein
MQFQIVAGEPCLDFVNTLDNRAIPGEELELLESYLALTEWAEQAGLISARQRRALASLANAHPERALFALRSAIRLRECLHRMFQRILSDQPPASADLALLGTYVASSYSHLCLCPQNGIFHLDWSAPAQRLDSVLWPVVKSVVALLTSEDLKRVRQCDISTCGWFFVDRSKNHSRRWCDMKICGNRVKARNFYGRNRQQGRGGGKLRARFEGS